MIFFDREFYASRAWKEARLARLAIDNYTCVQCGAKSNLQVHHKVSISKGGAKTAMYNLQTVCVTCHDHIHPHSYKFKTKKLAAKYHHG